MMSHSAGLPATQIDPYLSPATLRALAAGSVPPVVSEPCAVMFLDIVGFTQLVSGLAHDGPRGIDTLQRILAGFFGGTVDILHRAGGAVE